MTGSTKSSASLALAEKSIAARAASYPEVNEEAPWGHRAFKVRGKAFLFMSTEEGLSLSVKLPASGEDALGLVFAEPTGYGLGKSGWVTARFEAGDDVPLPLLFTWLDESFRAIAPKKVAALLGEAVAVNAPTVAKKKAATKTRSSESAPSARTKTAPKSAGSAASKSSASAPKKASLPKRSSGAASPAPRVKASTSKGGTVSAARPKAGAPAPRAKASTSKGGTVSAARPKAGARATRGGKR